MGWIVGPLSNDHDRPCASEVAPSTSLGSASPLVGSSSSDTGPEDWLGGGGLG